MLQSGARTDRHVILFMPSVIANDLQLGSFRPCTQTVCEIARFAEIDALTVCVCDPNTALGYDARGRSSGKNTQ